MSSERLSGTFLEMELISMLWNLAIFIQQSPEFVGRISDGSETLCETKMLPNNDIIVTTLTVSCVRNSGTDQTMVGNRPLSRSNQDCLSELFNTFNPSTSPPSLLTEDGKAGLVIRSLNEVISLLSQAESAGSMADVMTQRQYARQLLMTLRDHLQTW